MSIKTRRNHCDVAPHMRDETFRARKSSLSKKCFFWGTLWRKRQQKWGKVVSYVTGRTWLAVFAAFKIKFPQEQSFTTKCNESGLALFSLFINFRFLLCSRSLLVFFCPALLIWCEISFFAAVTCELFRLLSVSASANTAAGLGQKLCAVCAVTLMAVTLPAWCTASTGKSQNVPGNQTIYCLTNLELLAVSVRH